MQPRWKAALTWLRFIRPHAVLLACAALYLTAVALSIIIAHVLMVVHPDSEFAKRLVAPVTTGVAFIDQHWKSVLILIAPFLTPVVRALVPRLRKAGAFEFDPVPLEPVGVRAKPQKAAGDQNG